MAKHVTPRRLKAVFERILKLADEDKQTAKDFCDAFDAFLDDLKSEDFFGTEGQLDPRGDHRDE